MLLNENLFEEYEWNPDDASNDMIDMESDKPENQNISLEEDFSSSLPNWIIEDKEIIKLLSGHGIDLNKVKFIETNPPTSGWDPTIKNTNLLKVYRLKSDSKYPHYEVYIPGYNDDLHFDLEGNFRYKSITSYSTKQLLAHTINFGYIDLSDALNTTYQIRKDRFNAKKDDPNVDRDKFKQFSRTPKLGYEKAPDGSTDYDSPIYGDLEWLTQKGYDKSGYELNPNKYKDLLIKLKAENIQESLEEYYNKIENLRSSIIDKISSIDMKKKSGERAMDRMSSLINRLSSALYSYQEVSHELDSIQKGIEAGRWKEDEAKRWVQSSIESAFKSIDKDLEYSKGYFDEIDRLLAKDSENNNNNVIEESITPDINSSELQELAKKHNVDILSPMSNGDLRLSGAGADLMKFYQEAESLGLWEADSNLLKLDEAIHGYEESQKFFDLLRKIGIKDYTPINRIKYLLDQGRKHGKTEFEAILDAYRRYGNKIPDDYINGLTKEFMDLCWDIGIVTNEDFELFVNEEVKPGETPLIALKRYIEELKEMGFPFEKIRAESEQIFKNLNPDLYNNDNNEDSINEGKMSEISQEIDEAGGKENYIKGLSKDIDDLIETLDALQYGLKNAGTNGGNFESSDIPELLKDIEKAQEELTEKRAKLNYIQG